MLASTFSRCHCRGPRPWVQPLVAEPQPNAPERNRLLLRETAATLLHRLQGAYACTIMGD